MFMVGNVSPPVPPAVTMGLLLLNWKVEVLVASIALTMPVNSSTVGFFIVKPPKNATIRGRISEGFLFLVRWVKMVLALSSVWALFRGSPWDS